MTSSVVAGTPGAERPRGTLVKQDDDSAQDDVGIRIPFGWSKRVVVPADAVLDIKGSPEWDKAALRCTVTDAQGQQVKLLPPPDNVPVESAAHGGMWVPLWTIAASFGEVTVGCLDPYRKIPNTETSFVRVVPRGVVFGR
ncbi:hypothetical protein DE4585_03356 [Mycobacteroides salmoniphilum]|uniref:Uncharacterized protein n=1 Tax=Mycobacteroides salmoniphilum TaxID=404941 RepID=A0A4R8RZA5_9MYCO|nr:hypothetical protein [Mycobacteroides salmoniphilum]TDZ79609.1 hypothetical protein DE4585_03356 [Mycobacteroides salmoniphilum]TDZ81693.1 hypothetical protein DE4586_01652 [Mycobacteroides salmoniphilum]TDZ89193.1 hypothetical protein DE4587_01568 [Mycobacteroides salmoniphilum]